MQVPFFRFLFAVKFFKSLAYYRVFFFGIQILKRNGKKFDFVGNVTTDVVLKIPYVYFLFFISFNQKIRVKIFDFGYGSKKWCGKILDRKPDVSKFIFILIIKRIATRHIRKDTVFIFGKNVIIEIEVNIFSFD